MKFALKPYTSVATWLFVASLALPGAAFAQWGWTDKDGRRIFSDQAPPSDIADKNIIKRPGGSRAGLPSTATDNTATASLAASVASAAVVPKPAASGLKISGKDSELEKKKSAGDAAEAAKKKVADAKLDTDRAENCQRAKRAATQVGSGTRISTTNDKGEREIMSDSQRAAESRRLQDVIASDCK